MQLTAAAPARATQDSRPLAEALASRAERQPIRQHPTILRRLALPASMPRGPGRAHATIVWLFLATYLRWSGKHSMVWPSDETIAKRSGLTLRSVQRGLAYLRSIGKITVAHGPRPASRRRERRKVGRIIELHLLGDGPNPVVLWPSPKAVAGIWRDCSRARSRPAALVGLAIAMHVLAAAEQGAPLTGSASLTASMATMRALVGAAHGAAFNMRLADLESAGLATRIGKHWREGMIVEMPHAEPVERRPRLAPAPLRRLTAIPACPDLATLDDMLALDDEIASSQGWTRPPPARLPEGRILEWVDLREISKATGTGPARRLLTGRGPP
jgi:hypothetical protein